MQSNSKDGEGGSEEGDSSTKSASGQGQGSSDDKQSNFPSKKQADGESDGVPKMEKEARRRSITPLGSSSESDEDYDSEEDKLSTPSRSRTPSPLPQSRQHQRQPPFKPAAYIPTVDSMSNAVVNLFTLISGVIVFGVFLVGSYDYFKNVEDNKCEMTFMYHRPYYVPISLNPNPLEEDQETFPMYKLYAYAEGEPTLEAMSRDNYQFSGIPVLYIPGNAGSYQQVRSLASVALWKCLDAGTPFHFDFFTVDLNEEFTGLYGYSLRRQVQFVRKAVNRIVNLYEEFHRVVLIGHSMGGIIAKSVAMDQSAEDESSLANLILTLATPHANPIVILDPEQDIFYSSLKRNWTRHSEAGNKIALVSVAGGERDYLVAPKFTRWPDSIHTIATGVPGVWASTDHLCIVWCKQLVLTTIRALFDLVEFNQRNKYYAITEKHDLKLAVLNYHFVERHGGKSYHASTRQITGPINLSKNVEHIEVTSGIHCRSSGQRLAYLLFPRLFLMQNVSRNRPDKPLDKKGDHNVIALTTNTKEKNWIAGCLETSPTGQCIQAESLVQYGKVIPHIRRRRKMATVPLSLIASKYSHLVIKMDPYPFKTCVMLETFSNENRTSLLGGTFQANEKIFYNLTLFPTGFMSYLASWKVSAQPNNMTCPESHNLLAQFRHGNFEQNRFLKNESLVVRHFDWNVTSSSVQLFLEPTCNYTVTTTLAPLETAGQFFRVVVKLLPSFYASVVLMTLYFQKDPVEWSSFHIVLISNAYHLSIFPGFIVAVILHFLPTDWPLMVDTSEFTVLVPIICYLIAYCLVLAVSTGTWYAIITGGTAFHSVIVRLLSTRFGSWVPSLLSNHRGFTSVTEHVTEAAFEMTLTRFPLTIAVILLAVSFASCGSLGIALGFALFIIKLFKIYEDLLEDLLKAKIMNVTDSLSPMNFHFSCYMLWFVLTVLNVPSLLHWSRSFGEVAAPQWDLSMYLCLLTLPTVAILWQDFAPKMEPTIWKLHRYVFYAMGMVCVLWGTHRLYVTAFIITFVFLTMAVCQLVSVMLNSLVPGNTSNSSASSSEQTTQPSTTDPSSSPPPSASSDN